MRTLATFFCGLALASLIVPSSTAGQESQEIGQASFLQSKDRVHKIVFRIQLRKLARRSDKTTADQIRTVIRDDDLFDLVYETTVGQNVAANGETPILDAIQNLLQWIEENEDLIRRVIEIISGLFVTDHNADPPADPPLTNPDAQAAQALVKNISARLASNVGTIRTNAGAEEFTVQGMNSAISRGLDDAFKTSKQEFLEYSNITIINAPDPLEVLGHFVIGFGGK